VLDACVSALEATSGANDSDVTSYRAQIAQAKAQLLKTDPAKYATADAQVKAQVQKSGLDPTDIPNNAVALSTPSADSGAATGDAAQYHIVQILNQKDGNGSYYLQTASMVDSRKNPEKYGGSILTLSDCTEDWVLLVEPLVWLTIYPEGDDSRIVHTKMYGTITNFVQAFNTDPALAKYKNSKFFNWKALNQACWWALSVNSSGFGFAGSDLGFRAPENTGSYRPFADLYRGLTVPQTQTVTVARLQDDGTVEKTQEERSCIEGWGVNVYWKGMIPEEPQPTTQPDDTDDNGSKIKLAKWYVVETKTESGDTQQSVVGVKTGYVDKYLMVANELVNEGNGVYEVRGWITGKDATAVPEDGDLDSTFEEYAKKSPGSAWGTTAAVVNMSEFPEDKVLYVKLVYTPTTEQGTITVIKVKDKTDGSTVIEKDSTNPGVYNATEEGWEYKEDTQTPDDEIPVSKWPDVPQGTSGNNPQIPVLDTTHTLYIHYTEKPQSPVEGGRARNGQSAFLVCPPFYGQCHV
jgi:hypothetical protein